VITTSAMREIVERITYKPGWTILFGEDRRGAFVQASVSIESDATLDPTRKTTERTPWKSGKRYLSPHMCRQEIVGAVYGLFQDAEVHEMREWFRYRGASIYNPHLDPDALVDIARKRSSFCLRDDAMTMVEGANAA
jgi:hypothetical protein